MVPQQSYLRLTGYIFFQMHCYEHTHGYKTTKFQTPKFKQLRIIICIEIVHIVSCHTTTINVLGNAAS